MEAIKILKNKNLKKTASRIAIIKALQESEVPLSEGDIKQQMGDIYDRITFYRCIQTLMETGIIHRIIADNVTVRYVLNDYTEEHQPEVDHVHFFCTQCHLVLCLEDIKVQTYALPPGYKLQECDVVLKGLCEKCNN